MASNFAIGLLKGLGTGLKLDYEKQQLEQKRAWEELQVDNRVKESRKSYAFQKDYDSALKRLDTVSMPFEQYIAEQAREAASNAGLKGRESVNYSKAWAATNTNNSNRAAYLKTSEQARERTRRLREGEVAPASDLDNLEQLSFTSPEFRFGPAAGTEFINIINPKTNQRTTIQKGTQPPAGFILDTKGVSSGTTAKNVNIINPTTGQRTTMIEGTTPPEGFILDVKGVPKPPVQTAGSEKVAAITSAYATLANGESTSVERLAATGILKSYGADPTADKPDTLTITLGKLDEVNVEIRAARELGDANAISDAIDKKVFILKNTTEAGVGIASGNKKARTDAILKTGEFHKSGYRYANSIAKITAAVKTNPIASGTLVPALEAVFSNIRAEAGHLASLGRTPETEAMANKLKFDTEFWSQFETSQLSRDLLASAKFRDGLMMLTYAKMGMNGQTGKAVSAEEFKNQLSTLANVSDGNIIIANMMSLLDESDRDIRDYSKGLPKSLRAEIDREFDIQDLLDRNEEVRSGIRGPKPTPPSGAEAAAVAAADAKRQRLMSKAVTSFNSKPLVQRQEEYEALPSQLKAMIADPR